MIIRTYACDDCGTQFEIHCEPDDAEPECPQCTKVLEWLPVRLNIGTVKSKAIDVTQKIIEQDFGLSDLNDRNREGDVAYKAPAPMQTSERETIEQAVREYVRETTANVPIPAPNQVPQAKAADVSMDFWGGGTPQSIAAQPIATRVALQGAKIGPAADINPMQMLQDGIKAGQLPNKARIIARWRP